MTTFLRLYYTHSQCDSECPLYRELNVEITVNGVRQEATPGISLTQLLANLNILPERVAVEINLAVIDRKTYSQTALQAGDQIEIIGFVGGGR